jgi:hypothetical protein
LAKLERRLTRLFARLPTVPPAECIGPPTAIAAEDEEQIAGPDTQTCLKCGGVHLLLLKEVVVDASGTEIR